MLSKLCHSSIKSNWPFISPLHPLTFIAGKAHFTVVQGLKDISRCCVCRRSTVTSPQHLNQFRNWFLNATLQLRNMKTVAVQLSLICGFACKHLHVITLFKSFLIFKRSLYPVSQVYLGFYQLLLQMLSLSLQQFYLVSHPLPVWTVTEYRTVVPAERSILTVAFLSIISSYHQKKLK